MISSSGLIRALRAPGTVFGVVAAVAAGTMLVRRRLWTAVRPAPKWAALCDDLGVDEAVTQKWWKRIADMYGEPVRKYHTLEHIRHMLRLYTEHQHRLTKPASVQLAIFFHDIVYDPTSGSNEEDSAELYAEFHAEALAAKGAEGQELSAGEETISRTEVYDWIVQTKHHKVDGSDDDNLLLFLDFDMAILGTPWPAYASYCNKIRHEYGHIAHYDYCVGRASVLETFLEGRIFASELFHGKYELQARHNVQREIETLKGMEIPKVPRESSAH